MKYIVDANVLSEPTKSKPDARVVSWLRTHAADLAVTPIVLGELEYGILLLNAGKRRAQLHNWFVQGAQRMRTLDLDAQTGTAWAGLLARMRRKGTSMPIKDSLVAASALAHQLAIATRNVDDFRHAGVPLVNPFE